METCECCYKCHHWINRPNTDWGWCLGENANKTVRVNNVSGDYKNSPMETSMFFGCRYAFLTPESIKRFEKLLTAGGKAVNNA